MTDARDQGMCGASWAFTAVATMEGRRNINFTKGKFGFSEQQLIDCDPNSYGCDGGWLKSAF